MGANKKESTDSLGFRKTCNFNVNDDSQIVKFCKMQSNFNDAIRYLIQNYINERGVEDLDRLLPRNRASDFKLAPYGLKDDSSSQVFDIN